MFSALYCMQHKAQQEDRFKLFFGYVWLGQTSQITNPCTFVLEVKLHTAVLVSSSGTKYCYYVYNNVDKLRMCNAEYINTVLG